MFQPLLGFPVAGGSLLTVASSEPVITRGFMTMTTCPFCFSTGALSSSKLSVFGTRVITNGRDIASKDPPGNYSSDQPISVTVANALKSASKATRPSRHRSAAPNSATEIIGIVLANGINSSAGTVATRAITQKAIS